MVKKIKSGLMAFWGAITLVLGVIAYVFFTKNSNQELKKAKEKVQEREKVVKIAQEEYDASQEEIKRIRKETDKMLNQLEKEREDINGNKKKVKLSPDDARHLLDNILGRDGNK